LRFNTQQSQQLQNQRTISKDYNKKQSEKIYHHKIHKPPYTIEEQDSRAKNHNLYTLLFNKELYTKKLNK